MIKSGTKWQGGEHYFRVLGVIEIEGKTWVYYKKEGCREEPNEFSCLEESFLSRFTQIVNE
jgi:hypothetical protein